MVAHGVGRVDFQVELLRDGRRDVPDELAGVVEAVGNCLPLDVLRPGRSGRHESTTDLGGKWRSLAFQAIATFPALTPVPICGVWIWTTGAVVSTSTQDWG